METDGLLHFILCISLWQSLDFGHLSEATKTEITEMYAKTLP